MAAKRGGAAVVSTLALVGLAGGASAQVVFDGTLRPSNAGQPPPNVAPPLDPPDYVIDEDDGLPAGTNLLHSFLEFSIPDGGRATFTGDSSFQNVIARVTGDSASLIQGTLVSEVGEANFFFVNPNGITFQNVLPDTPGSKIVVPGSFFASTADALLFAGGERFESDGIGGTAPGAILSAPSAWEFSAGASGDVVVDQTLPLGGSRGQTLGLVGGDVRIIEAATLEARTGSIEIAAVGENAAVVPIALAGWTPPDAPLGDIIVTEGSTLDVRDLTLDGTPGGRVVLRGGRLVIDDLSVVNASGDASIDRAGFDASFTGDVSIDDAEIEVDHRGAVGAGATRIVADQLTLTNGAIVRTRSFEDAGDLTIAARRVELDQASLIEASTTTGRGADIEVAADAVFLRGGSAVQTGTFASGRAGDVRLVTDRFDGEGLFTVVSSVARSGSGGTGGDVLVAGSRDGLQAAERVTLRDGARLEAVTATDGAGGDLTIVADAVVFEGSAVASGDQRSPSGLQAVTGRSATEVGIGDGGTIVVRARSLALSEGAEIRSQTFGDGDAGDIRIAAEAVEASGFDTKITSTTEGAGDGGDVTIAATTGGATRAERVALRAGAQIESTTLDVGDAGRVRVAATEVTIEGGAAQGRDVFPSGIFARSGQSAFAGDATGDAGSIEVEAETVRLAGSGTLSSRSFGSGRSGTIRVDADASVLLLGDAAGTPSVSTFSEGGDSVGIALGTPAVRVATERLEVRDGAAIATDALAAGAAGDVEIVVGSVLVEGSQGVSPSSIRAQSSGVGASSGSGGDVRIEATDRIEIRDGGDVSVRSRGAGASGAIALVASGDVRIENGATLRSTAEGTGAAGDIEIASGAAVVVRQGAALVSESLLTADAGSVSVRATDRIDVTGSRIDATANAAAGAEIELVATTGVSLDRSVVASSVEGRAGEGDAGNVSVSAAQITINESAVLAQATLGDGGRIALASERYLASSESRIDASSTAGISGVVDIEAPDSNLPAALARLSTRIVDPGGLLRAPCAARARDAGSFVVSNAPGLSRSLRRGGSLPLPGTGPTPPAKGDGAPPVEGGTPPDAGARPRADADPDALAPSDCSWPAPVR